MKLKKFRFVAINEIINAIYNNNNDENDDWDDLMGDFSSLYEFLKKEEDPVELSEYDTIGCGYLPPYLTVTPDYISGTFRQDIIKTKLYRKKELVDSFNVDGLNPSTREVKENGTLHIYYNRSNNADYRLILFKDPDDDLNLWKQIWILRKDQNGSIPHPKNDQPTFV